MSRSASGHAPEHRAFVRDEADEQALVAAAMLLTAAGYRVDPMPPALPVIEAQGDRPSLTARERQVASLLVEGASNKVIARRLDISVHTAKFHVAAVLEKLGARNRSDAVAIALRDGLVAL
jgi:DNA-binding NarL/FixJ family response regulator